MHRQAEKNSIIQLYFYKTHSMRQCHRTSISPGVSFHSAVFQLLRFPSFCRQLHIASDQLLKDAIQFCLPYSTPPPRHNCCLLVSHPKQQVLLSFCRQDTSSTSRTHSLPYACHWILHLATYFFSIFI